MNNLVTDLLHQVDQTKALKDCQQILLLDRQLSAHVWLWQDDPSYSSRQVETREDSRVAIPFGRK